MSRLQRRFRHVRDIAANALNRPKISEIRSSIAQLIAGLQRTAGLARQSMSALL